MSREKLLLVVVVGAPRQHRTDIHALATNLAHHVVWQYAFGWILVVTAARRMNMVVSRIPAVFRGIDPSLQLEFDLRRTLRVDGEILLPGQVFRAAGISYGVLTLGKAQDFPIRAVNLRLKEEIWRQALGRIRIKTIQLVANHK